MIIRKETQHGLIYHPFVESFWHKVLMISHYQLLIIQVNIKVHSLYIQDEIAFNDNLNVILGARLIVLKQTLLISKNTAFTSFKDEEISPRCRIDYISRKIMFPCMQVIANLSYLLPESNCLVLAL